MYECECEALPLDCVISENSQLYSENRLIHTRLLMRQLNDAAGEPCAVIASKNANFLELSADQWNFTPIAQSFYNSLFFWTALNRSKKNIKLTLFLDECCFFFRFVSGNAVLNRNFYCRHVLFIHSRDSVLFWIKFCLARNKNNSRQICWRKVKAHIW